MRRKRITIVGGGLAGLTLGIGLRQQGVPVTVHEAGQYPRHRVCGEFISGEGQQVLQRLGVLNELREQVVEATTAMFVAASRPGPARAIAPPALCLSRFVLDASLATRFESLGGELFLNHRWQGGVEEGTVHASGRRPQPKENG